MMSLLNSPAKVVLADDHEMVREALARILEASGQISIVAQASNGEEAIDLSRSTEPDVIVLDYTMPKHDTTYVIEELLRLVPKIKVLILTVHENIHYAVRVLECGAHGYLIKSAAVEELLEAIDNVRQGRIYLSKKIADDVLQHLRRPKRNRVGLEALSQREFDFLRLLGSGESLQDCAKLMDISSSTASTYRSRILEKLNLTSTASVIRYAIEHDLVK